MSKNENDKWIIFTLHVEKHEKNRFTFTPLGFYYMILWKITLNGYSRFIGMDVMTITVVINSLMLYYF